MPAQEVRFSRLWIGTIARTFGATLIAGNSRKGLASLKIRSPSNPLNRKRFYLKLRSFFNLFAQELGALLERRNETLPTNDIQNCARHHFALIMMLVGLISAGIATSRRQVMRNQRNHARHHVALILALVGSLSLFTLVMAPARLASAQVLYPSWTYTGDLNVARDGHTATLLQSGKVLVVGGNRGANGAELYDPSTGRWIVTGNLITPRGIPTATLLLNGKVLVAGGEGEAFNSGDSRKALDSVELYDPTMGTWSSTSNLTAPRENHTATLLPNGKVLVAGGLNRGGDNNGVASSAELYDPATGTWSRTGNLSGDKIFGHTATPLPNGKVVVAGTALNVALYDPFAGTWSITAYLNAHRALHTATLLPSGKVLVAGGDDRGMTAELYDPGNSLNSNIIDDAKFFAQQHYFDFLQRAPDANGLAFWTNEITSCDANQHCIEVKRINVSAAFYLSIEFQETGYFVYRVNKAAHGNLPGAPVPVKVDEFLGETAQVGQGVIVGQPGWEQTLESNKQLFLFDPDVGDDR